MLYPVASGQEHHHLKAGALEALIPGYAGAGAEVVVVSGVVDSAIGPGETISALDLTLCRLSPGPTALRHRVLSRGGDEEEAAEVVADDRALRDAAFIDAEVDTTALTVSETVERLRPLVPLRELPAGVSLPMACSPAQVDVVVVTGPRAAGSSTVGYGLAARRWKAGLPTGFLDLQQLAFLASRKSRSPTDTSLGITQLATLHAFMAASGAQLLVVSGHLDVHERAALRRALPSARVMVIRLRADATTLAAHVQARIAGRSARLAGDDLLGAASDHQAATIQAALAEQEDLDAHVDDDLVIDVTDRNSAHVITEIERLVAPRAS